MFGNVEVEQATKGKCKECGEKYNKTILYRVKKYTKGGESYSYICKDCSRKAVLSIANILKEKEDPWVKEIIKGTDFEGRYNPFWQENTFA